MTSPTDEQQFVRAFFKGRHRDRWLTMLDTAKGREKFLEFLHHGTDALDERHSIDANDWSINQIVNELRARGANASCFVFSEWHEVDRMVMELEDAIAMLVGCQMGSVASCIPRRLAYWEGEGPSDRYICFRKTA